MRMKSGQGQWFLRTDQLIATRQSELEPQEVQGAWNAQ